MINVNFEKWNETQHLFPSEKARKENVVSLNFRTAGVGPTLTVFTLEDVQSPFRLV